MHVFDKLLTCELIRWAHQTGFVINAKNGTPGTLARQFLHFVSFYVQWPQFCVQKPWLVGHSCPVPDLVLLCHITTRLQLIKQTWYAVVSKETFPKRLVPNPPSRQDYKKIADRCVALEMNCNPYPTENLLFSESPEQLPLCTFSISYRLQSAKSLTCCDSSIKWLVNSSLTGSY